MSNEDTTNIHEPTYLHVTRSSVEVQMKILDLSIFAKFVHQVFFSRFLVYIGDQNDPSFNG